MVGLLIKIFIKNSENTSDPKIRAKYATITGVVGIFFNVLLFALKIIAGILSSSISVIADAFNNLSDAATSIITMIGFRLASHEADSEHPFGHGRSEYISALITAIFILLVGYELIKSSIEKIIHPLPIEFSGYIAVFLIISILVKAYMYVYNKNISEKLESKAIYATAKDSINDVFVTASVLLSLLLGHYMDINIDAFMGIAVGIFIIKGGIDIFKETSGQILGESVDENFKDKIRALVDEYEEILDIHDLIVHDYGPGRRIISFHAEVDAKGDIILLHDCIDNIERRICEELESQAVIHMDPIITDDEEINYLKDMVIELVSGIEPTVSVHDFRVVKGNTHTNLIFDILLPFEAELGVEDIKKQVSEAIRKMEGNFYGVITIDRPI